ncbi:MAG: hypothetical protein K0S47_1497 [Herbinix sp.]|jgi:hypothetical protein|nr:hypothetical protein [Herbinix sp.]
MSTEVRRGYVPSDAQEFNKESLLTLKKAQEEVLWLIERGYPIKGVSTFVGNHYMLSERQRLAFTRATSTREILHLRKEKQIQKVIPGSIVYIDGLNLIISLEIALSGSTLIRCMDGTIRDLAGLRGTYRLIDKTDGAIRLIGEQLEKRKVNEAIFYLDAPVSNTGRLKQRILELMQNYNFKITVELVNNADVILEKLSNIVTSDAIILNRCISWINLAAEIIDERLPEVPFIDLRL